MLKVKVIGIGAAGGKAAIAAIEKIPGFDECVRIINTTEKDIPGQYQELFMPMQQDSLGGCGKERSKSKNLAIAALQDGTIDLKSFLEADDQLVILVTSTEGGTGSGATPIIANYINFLGFNVHIMAFTGFDDDVRGLKNTIDFFKEIDDLGISDRIAIETISNKKLLDIDGGNRSKAEAEANDEFVFKLEILMGRMIESSSQNIDETDLFKLSVATHGYMMIENRIFDSKIKNQKEFNNLLNEILDDTKSLETNKGVERIGVILNVSESTLNHIDNDFKVLRERYGEPLEFFRHIQPNIVHSDEYICIIASGMDMPLDSIKKTYLEFKSRAKDTKQKNSDFFDFLQDASDASDSFDGLKDIADVAERKKRVDDAAFFSNLNKSVAPDKKNNMSDF